MMSLMSRKGLKECPVFSMAMAAGASGTGASATTRTAHCLDLFTAGLARQLRMLAELALPRQEVEEAKAFC